VIAFNVVHVEQNAGDHSREREESNEFSGLRDLLDRQRGIAFLGFWWGRAEAVQPEVREAWEGMERFFDDGADRVGRRCGAEVQQEMVIFGGRRVQRAFDLGFLTVFAESGFERSERRAVEGFQMDDGDLGGGEVAV